MHFIKRIAKYFKPHTAQIALALVLVYMIMAAQFERFIDPDLDAAYADDWATLDRVEIIDEYNGIIVLKEPFAPLWTSTLPVGSGTIISR